MLSQKLIRMKDGSEDKEEERAQNNSCPVGGRLETCWVCVAVKAEYEEHELF